MLSYLEAKLGRFAIPHLIPGIVFLCTITFVFLKLQPDFINYLVLDPELILQGQVWRLFTYIFIPPNVHIIFIVFAFMFLWTLGNGLEQAWGSFRLNLYFLLGILSTTVLAFVFNRVDATGAFIYSSFFFAFATFYPNYQILLFFIIPIKIKWLAYFSLVLLIFSFINSSTVGKLVLILGHLNYFVFFGRDLIKNTFQKHTARLRKKNFEAGVEQTTANAFHQCIICKRNEITHPQIFFRVAADGQEYCQKHLP